MKKMKIVAAAAALLGSTSAFAGVTGNVGAFSEYLFRGVEQTTGTPAVQGGVDLATDSGFYVGAWISNTNFAAVSATGSQVSYETDVYGGYAFKLGSVGVDLGALYYYYRDDTALNTLEFYAGLTIGALSVKGFVTDDYFGTDEGGLYLTASAAIPLSDTLTLTPQVGSSSGDGPKAFFGNNPGSGAPDGEYIDYSLTLAKSLDNGFTFSLAVVGTDLDTTVYANDKEKVVLGLKKSFDL
jgi:uncharacterized protein (TIGR02001 family)